MKTACLVLFALLPYSPALAQVTPAGKPPAERPQVQRNSAFEERVLARQDKMAEVLRIEVRRRLKIAANAVMAKAASGHVDQELSAMAKQEAHERFRKLTAPQTELLAFYILADMTRALTTATEINSEFDAMGNPAELTAVRMQMMLDRQSKLMTTLGSIMQTLSDSDDSILRNLK